MISEYKCINGIVKKIRSCNYSLIDEAIEDLINLNSRKAFNRFLKNTLIDKKGVLWVNPKFVVTGPTQPAMDYAFWEIIGNTPNKILLENGIDRNKRKTIRFKRHKSIAYWTHGIHKFPKGILNFKNLQRLYLGYCNIDSITDEIFKLSSLKELTCNSYDLKNLPTSIGKLVKLTSLDLRNCSLKKLPDSLVNLKLLTKLNLSDNSLKKLPDSFGNICQLKELNLSSNCLKSIPKSIDELINLEELDLSFNEISHLKNIFSLNALKNLDISSNKINKLPKKVEKLQSIKSLKLNYNLGCIEIDSGLSKLNNLSYMSFYGSQATPRLSRKEFKNRNDINQYFKKIRRYYKEPHDDLIYVKPTPYSCNSYSNKPKKSPYKKNIQNQINFVRELIFSRDNNNFIAGINILENIDDINVFIGSTENYFYIDSTGYLVCHYDKNNKLAFIKLLNLYKRRNLNFKNFKIDRIKELSIHVPKKKDELFDELLIFKNLTKLKLLDIDSTDCFKFEIFSQIENLTISSSTFFDFNISKDILPKLQTIVFTFCEIDKITITNCENLIDFRSANGRYFNDGRSLIKYFKVVNCPKLNEIHLLTKSQDLSYFEVTNAPNLTFLKIIANLDLCKLVVNSTQYLKKIILKECCLTSLPQFVKESTLCEFLDLENNKINEDSIDFKGLTSILDLNLNKNKFTALPSSIYNLKKLKSLAISGQIKLIDHKIRNLKQLKGIFLGWNDNTLRKHYFLLKNLKDIR